MTLPPRRPLPYAMARTFFPGIYLTCPEHVAAHHGVPRNIS